MNVIFSEILPKHIHIQEFKIFLLSTYNVTGKILDINTWLHIYVHGSHITQTSVFVLFSYKNVLIFHAL